MSSLFLLKRPLSCDSRPARRRRQGAVRSASIAAPADAETVDAAGKILFLSFIDAHALRASPAANGRKPWPEVPSSAAHGGFGLESSSAWRTPIRSTTTPR